MRIGYQKNFLIIKYLIIYATYNRRHLRIPSESSSQIDCPETLVFGQPAKFKISLSISNQKNEI